LQRFIVSLLLCDMSGTFAVALDIGDECDNGLRFSLPDQGAAAAAVSAAPKLLGGGQGHASWVEQDGVQKGHVMVKYAGEWSFRKRFLVYSRLDTKLRIFKAADDSLMNVDPERKITIAICRVRGPPGGHDLALRTDEGETLLCRVSSDAEAKAWLDAFESAHETTVAGYVFINRGDKKGWKRRYAVYETVTQNLCLYQAREGDLSNRAFFYAQAFEAKPRGCMHVHHALRHATQRRPLGFTCYSDKGQVMLLSADGPNDLEEWMAALPDPNAAAPHEPGVRRGAITRRGSSMVERALIAAMKEEVTTLRQRVQAQVVRESKRHEVGLVWLDESAPGPPPPPGAGAAVEALAGSLGLARIADANADDDEEGPPVGGGAGGLLAGANLGERISVQRASMMSSLTEELDAEEEELERERALAEYALMAAEAAAANDEEDDDDVPPPLGVGLSVEQLAAHAKPVISEEGRAKLVASESMTRELEALKAQLEAARVENMKLKTAVGDGATTEGEEEACLQNFLRVLKAVVQMRREGKFDAALFDEYNGALVQLSDAHMREMYQSFMLLYVGEADEALLTRLGVDDVDDALLGFAEMMTIKVRVLRPLAWQSRDLRVCCSCCSSAHSHGRAETCVSAAPAAPPPAVPVCAMVLLLLPLLLRLLLRLRLLLLLRRLLLRLLLLRLLLCL
jgi:hypothetical protein